MKRACQLIREARLANDITQVNLAKRLGISQPQLSKIESEIAEPTLPVWLVFCHLFSVPASSIAREKDFKQTLKQVGLGTASRTLAAI